MNVASFFSGVGGLDLGLHRAGMRTVSLCEADEWRRRVLAARWPGVPISDDVRNGVGDARPDFAGPRRVGGRDGTRDAPGGVELVAGGVPCQDWSVAGRRAGIQGARSGLFFDWADRIAEFPVRPRWIVFENVPGLLSAGDGRDFGTVLGTLADLGYGLAWRVLDARFFGVPQRRRRVFVVGHSGGEPGPAVRALGAGGEGDLAAGVCSWQGVAGSARGGVAPVGGRGGRDGEGGVTVVSTLQAHGKGRGYRIDAEGAAGGHLIPLTAKCLTASERWDAETETFIPAQVGPLVRRLTPVECERLMSWPDDWTAPVGVVAPDSRRYAACGDGVVANVAEWIGRRVLAVDDELRRVA